MSHTDDNGHPEWREDAALLRERLRLGVLLFTVNLPVFALADLYLSPRLAPGLWGIKIAGLGLAAAVLWRLRRPHSWRQLVGWALMAVAGADALSAVSGVVTADPVTPPLVCVAVALVTATTFPWGARPQGAVAAVSLATIGAHAALLGAGLTYPSIGAAVTVCLSVYVAYSFDGERRRMRDEVRAGRERDRITFEHAAVGIAHVAPDGRWLRVNPRLCEILGYTPEALLGGCFQDVTHGDDLDDDLEHVREMLAGERQSYAMEKRYVHRDGSLVWANLTVSLVRDASGAPDYFISIVEDIGDRKRAETQIRALNEDLHTRSRELEDANRELEAFSYSVSHDLRTPLRTIEGFATILLEDYGAALDAAGQHHVERVRAAAVRMRHLIDDLLLLAQVSRRAMRRQTVDVSAVAEAIADELREAEPARQTHIAVAPGMAANADPNLLRIALDNLLANAWKFTARRRPGHIAVAVEAHGGEPALVVRDDGAGFDGAHADRLFRPFQRFHSSAEFEGTGIGLAIVESVVRRHGGRIHAEATPDEGATFVFTLGRGAVAVSPPARARA